MQVYAFKINNYLDIYYYIEAEKAFFNTFDKKKQLQWVSFSACLAKLVNSWEVSG